jgi:hypothetical protein
MLPARESDPASEFVYFAYSAGRIKIGYSRGVEGRCRQLATSGPFPPVLILIVHGTVGLEQDFHVRFHEDRIHGEWFKLSPSVRSFLQGHLCDIGRSSLDAAEKDYLRACETFIANYKPPPKRSIRKHCEHGMPIGGVCAPCERERDLAVLSRIRNRESSPFAGEVR